MRGRVFENARGALAHGEIAADERHQRARMPLLFRVAQQRFSGVEWLEFIFRVDEHQGLCLLRRSGSRSGAIAPDFWES